nr:hypothetical protein [Tanacetum cinerariifolium]
KTEHNIDFHQIVGFFEAIHLRIEKTNQETKILATVDGKPRTISESSLRRHLKLSDDKGISSLPDTELFENLSMMGYNILPNQRFTFQKVQFSHQWKFLIHTIMQCLSPKSTGFNQFSSNIATAVAFPTVSSLDAGQDRENINKTSALPHESSPRVTSLDADEGSMQQRLQELMELYTSLQRQQSQMAAKIKEQDLEKSGLKARVKFLKDKDRGSAEPTQEDAPIKGGIKEIGEEVGADKSTKIWSNDTEEMVNVLSLMEAANILTSRVAAASVSPVTVGITIRGAQYMRSPIIGAKDKGKQKVVESEVPKKRKLQEQIDAQVAKEMEEEFTRKKSKGLKIKQGSSKRMKTSEDVSKEDLKGMMQLVPLEEVYVKALQVKHPIIDWEIHSEGKRKYWKIIRLGGHTTVYQFFIDMLKQFDREDLHQLWTLVKETFSIRQATKDKEKELWVELKRLFEPDFEDQLWTHNQAFMHDPLDWKLYDTCGVHYVFTKDQEIFMLVEKDYPLRRGLATVMICNKLQVEQYSQMANDLILKIHNIANSLR